MSRHHVPPLRKRVIVGPTPEEKLAGIKECLLSGDRLQAIEIYRGWKGVDVPEAKSAVDEIERELHAAVPDGIFASAWRRGWVGIAVLIAFVVSVWLFLG
jgi:hypothetical protein